MPTEVATRRRYTPEARAEAVRRYVAGEPMSHIAADTGAHPTTLREWVLAAGHAMRPPGGPRIYVLDESAFDADTPEVRYWLGFLSSDGWISLGRVIGLSLTIGDRSHVEAFREFLKATHPISVEPARAFAGGGGNASESVRLVVRSTRLVAALAARGVAPGKASREAIPADLALDRDFWRGMVDADGHLYAGMHYLKRTKRDHLHTEVGMCGTRAVCESFAAFALARVGPTRYGKAPTLTRVKSIWRVKVSGKAAMRMAELLYSNACVALPRKAERAAAFAALASHQ